MFEYEYFDEERAEGRLAAPVNEPVPDDFVKPADITLGRTTWWREHCVECSEPLCFSVCSRYAPRADGRCRRFAYGIRSNPDPAFADFPEHAELEFAPWGKLETIIYQHIVPFEQTVELNRTREARCEQLRAMRAANPDEWTQERWDAEHPPYGDMLGDADHPSVGTQTDTFLLQLYAHDAEPYVLSFEVTTLRKLVLRRTLEIKPGYNQFIVNLPINTGVRKDSTQDNDLLLGRIVAQGDFCAHVTILAAEFITLQAQQAAEPKPIPEKPAKKVKCVCWDLDNTVWAGTLIESEPDELELRPGVLDTMKELDERGIVQCVVSKNDEKDVRPVLERLGIADLFVYVIANWSSKSSNIRTACDWLNIGLDTFAHVDDQAFERSEISETLPCVRVYDEKSFDEMLASEPFNVPVTAESRARRVMYQEEAARQDVAASFAGDNTEFLRTCQMKLTLFQPTEPAQVKRSFELVQRTNQLNLSARRYEEDDFEGILAALGKRAVAAYAGDRFGEYGQIAYCVIEALGNALFVREFAMSCRVMGKGVEEAFLSWLMRRASSLGLEYVVFKGIRTARNGLLVRTLVEAGLSDCAIDEGQILLAVRADDVIQDLDIVELDESAMPPVELADLAWEDAEGFPYVLSASERTLFGERITEIERLTDETTRLQGEIDRLAGETGALRTEIDELNNSKTMMAGRMATFLPRVARDVAGRALGKLRERTTHNENQVPLASPDAGEGEPAPSSADEGRSEVKPEEARDPGSSRRSVEKSPSSSEDTPEVTITRETPLAFPVDGEPRDILFFVPHQDDEMLTFGVGIIQAVRAGHRVHVILCVDGGLDGARGRLASGEKCELNTLDGGKFRLHGGRHHYSFTREEFSALRDAEFRASCEQMGVLPCRTHIFPDRTQDGCMTVDQAIRSIEPYLALFPDAIVVTEVPNAYPVYDPIADVAGQLPPGPHWYHLDHRELGRGAQKLFDEGRIAELHFFADPYHKPRIDEISPEGTYEVITPTDDEKAQLMGAVEVYRTWRPANQQFAIGWHSAHEIFPTTTGDFNNYRYVLKRSDQ